MSKPISHYGHNVDITETPFFCTDCDVEITTNGFEPHDYDVDEVRAGWREFDLMQFTTEELVAELARRGYETQELLDD